MLIDLNGNDGRMKAQRKASIYAGRHGDVPQGRLTQPLLGREAAVGMPCHLPSMNEERPVPMPGAPDDGLTPEQRAYYASFMDYTAPEVME